MFGRAKKSIEVGKPADLEEELAVQLALHKKYPNMMKKTGIWGKPKKKTVAAKNNLRTGAVKKAMGDSAGGIKTDAEKEAERNAKK
jgi:hypothetical protein